MSTGQTYSGTGGPVSGLERFVQVCVHYCRKKPVCGGLCRFMQVCVRLWRFGEAYGSQRSEVGLQWLNMVECCLRWF